MVGVVLVFLRCLGITNAAVWFGAAIFFTAGIEPAFLAPDMGFLPESHSGVAAQLILERYFALQYWCGGLALVHLVGESLYTGRTLFRWPVYLVVGLLLWGCLGAFWLQPKLIQLHVQKHGVRATELQRASASKSFARWNAFAQTGNFFLIIGLFVYLIEVTSAGGALRFIASNKFRG